MLCVSRMGRSIEPYPIIPPVLWKFQIVFREVLAGEPESQEIGETSCELKMCVLFMLAYDMNWKELPTVIPTEEIFVILLFWWQFGYPEMCRVFLSVEFTSTSKQSDIIRQILCLTFDPNNNIIILVMNISVVRYPQLQVGHNAPSKKMLSIFTTLKIQTLTSQIQPGSITQMKKITHTDIADMHTQRGGGVAPSSHTRIWKNLLLEISWK